MAANTSLLARVGRDTIGHCGLVLASEIAMKLAKIIDGILPKLCRTQHIRNGNDDGMKKCQGMVVLFAANTIVSFVYCKAFWFVFCDNE